MTSTELNLETAEIQGAIDEAAARGGGRVVVSAGTHYTGGLRLRTGVELHLESGALLQFVADPALYPVVDGRWEGSEEAIYAPCLYAFGEKNIAITGRGVIDGDGAPWWDVVRNRRDELEHARPTLIGLHECECVLIRDVMLRNSPSWTVHPAMCNNVTVDGISINNPADSPNTDGIDPESCSNVHISNCHIDVGDDCIAVKAGTQHAAARVPCENVTITNCTMVHGHGGVVLGSEMSGGVRNVVISNCVFQSTDRGIRIKTRRGRGGLVEDFRVNNVIMDGVLVPFVINPYYYCGPDGKEPHVGEKAPYPVDEGTPMIRRLHISNVSARRVNASAGVLFGLPESPLSEVTVTDYAVSFADNPEPGNPDMAICFEPVVREGLRLENVIDSTLSRVRIVGAEGPLVAADECRATTIEIEGDDVGRG